jgi:predicted PurR-regulated permease PerM
MNSFAGRQLLFWGAAFLVFAVIVALLREVLLPFALGLILAYFLNPLAAGLERVGFSRTWATIAIFAMFLIVSALFMLLVGPLLVAQVRELASQVPTYLAQLHDIASSLIDRWFGQYLPGGEAGVREAMQNAMKQAAGQLAGLLGSVLSSGMAVVSFFSLFLITPVVAFMLMLDWNELIRRVDSWLPREHAPVIRLLAKRMDRSTDAFVHGQLMIAIILGTYYALALTASGLKYGLLIGLTAGVINIVPFLGWLTGLLIATTMAVVQFWPEWQPIAIVAAIFLIAQLIDGYLLTPKLIGEKLGLHPLWLMFALFTASYLFGVLGTLIAIPVAAAIGVLVRYGLERYLDSSLYLGTRGSSGGQGA